MIPKTQHRLIAIKTKAAVSPHDVPFKRRYNIKKAGWEGFAKSVDMDITDIVPTMDPLWTLSRKQQDGTSYICGITDESKELYEDDKMQFEDDPFNS